MAPLGLLLLALLPCLDGDFSAGRRVEIPPVPPLLSDGQVPDEPRDRYVFLDESNGFLVLAYPVTLQTEGQTPGPGRSTEVENIIERVELAVGVCPVIEATVHERLDESRRYDCQYDVANDSSAKQPLGRWIVPVPPGNGIEQSGSPWGWVFEITDEGDSAAILEAKSASWGPVFREQMSLALLRNTVRWYAQFSNYVVAPGARAAGFKFVSDARPGIGRVYFQALTYMIGTRNILPVAVGHQVWAFNFVENNSVSMPAIVPRFVGPQDDPTVAADFYENIQALIAEGTLQAESRNVQRILKQLMAIIGESRGTAARYDWLAEESQNQLEVDIMKALRVSLPGHD